MTFVKLSSALQRALHAADCVQLVARTWGLDILHKSENEFASLERNAQQARFLAVAKHHVSVLFSWVVVVELGCCTAG